MTDRFISREWLESLLNHYVNIKADRLELNRDENMIYAWNGAERPVRSIFPPL